MTTALSRRLRFVAWAQVWGTATGTYIAGRLLFALARAPVSWPSITVVIAVLAFYTVAGAGAILFLRGHRLGRALLILAQFPQLMYLQTTSMNYQVLSGIYGVVYLQGSNGGFQFGITSTFSIHWGQSDLVGAFGVNLVAFGILVYLLNHPPGPAVAVSPEAAPPVEMTTSPDPVHDPQSR